MKTDSRRQTGRHRPEVETNTHTHTDRQIGGQTVRAAELPAALLPLPCRTPKLIKDLAGATLKRLVETD